MALTIDQAANDPSTPATPGIVRRLARPNGVNTEVIILPENWRGKFVRFSCDDDPTSGNVLYIRFARTAADATIVIAADSALSAGPNPPAGTVFEAGTEPDLTIPAGSFVDERIDEQWLVLGHIAGAATGKARFVLKQGDDFDEDAEQGP